MIPIATRPDFLLEATVTPNPCGVSLELFQTYPKAQHPRAQRLVQLNLTRQEYMLLAAACDHAAYGMEA